MSGTIRVRITNACVPDFDRLAEHPQPIVGRRWVTTDSEQRLEDTEQPFELPVREEYLVALRAGDLLAADKATADLAGVPFSNETAAQPHVDQGDAST